MHMDHIHRSAWKTVNAGPTDATEDDLISASVCPPKVDSTLVIYIVSLRLTSIPSFHTKMPAVTSTRATRAIASVATNPTGAVPSAKAPPANGRRTISKPTEKSMIIDSRAAVEESAARKRRKVEPKTKDEPSVTPVQQPMTNHDGITHHYRPSNLPVEPKFSVQEAMDHLIGFDPRFKGLFSAMKCRPFVEPFQALDPFRTLATSIVGQQASP